MRKGVGKGGSGAMGLADAKALSREAQDAGMVIK